MAYQDYLINCKDPDEFEQRIKMYGVSYFLKDEEGNYLFKKRVNGTIVYVLRIFTNHELVLRAIELFTYAKVVRRVYEKVDEVVAHQKYKEQLERELGVLNI